jgi:hypothetical protein
MKNKTILMKWAKDKLSLKHQFVRQYQSFVIPSHDTAWVFEHDNVEIDVPRSFVDDFDPAHLVLNRLEAVQ